MFNIDSRKFEPFEYANEPVTLKRKVLGFLSYFTRIGYNPRDYEYYFSMDNYVEAACSVCDMVLGGMPREEYEKWDAERTGPEYCGRCKEYEWLRRQGCPNCSGNPSSEHSCLAHDPLYPLVG
jgi:hypothetical protein